MVVPQAVLSSDVVQYLTADIVVTAFEPDDRLPLLATGTEILLPAQASAREEAWVRQALGPTTAREVGAVYPGTDAPVFWRYHATSVAPSWI